MTLRKTLVNRKKQMNIIVKPLHSSFCLEFKLNINVKLFYSAYRSKSQKKKLKYITLLYIYQGKQVIWKTGIQQLCIASPTFKLINVLEFKINNWFPKINVHIQSCELEYLAVYFMVGLSVVHKFK